MGKVNIRARHSRNLTEYFYNGIYIGFSCVLTGGYFFKSHRLVGFIKQHGLQS